MNKIVGRRFSHFVPKNFKPQPSKLSSAQEVGRFYDNFVPVCVDVVPVIGWRGPREQRKILLGLRPRHPRGWWAVGRTTKPGESLVETANRTLFEEFGFDLRSLSVKGLPKRFHFACASSCVFPLREQPRQENGRHVFIFVLFFEVRQNEIKKFAAFKNNKYLETKWFLCSEITENFGPHIHEVSKCF